MTRPRTRPIHPDVQNVMNEINCPRLSDLSSRTGIDHGTLSVWADKGLPIKTLNNLSKLIKPTGKSLDELVTPD